MQLQPYLQRKQFSKGENLQQSPSAYDTDKRFQVKQSLGPGNTLSQANPSLERIDAV